MTKYQEDLDSVFRALADPTRRAVVARLCSGPASVSDLAKPFDMKLPTFMQHVRVLERSGLVLTKKIGRVRTCEMQPAKLSDAERWITDQRALWAQRLDRLEAFLHETSPTEDDA